MPDEPEVAGLLALMLLVESRRPARVGPDGALVLLADQDRTLWDAALIAEGQGLVRRCLRRNQPGRIGSTAINAVHSDALTAADTDWRQIVLLYDQLLEMAPRSGRRAAPRGGRGRGGGSSGGSGPRRRAGSGRPSRLPRRPGRSPTPTGPGDEAAEAYGSAIDLAGNESERAFLQRRRDALMSQDDAPQRPH